MPRALARSRCSRLGVQLAGLALLAWGALPGCRDSRDEAWPVEVVGVSGHTDSRAPSDAWTRRVVSGAMSRSVLFTPSDRSSALDLQVEYWELPSQPTGRPAAGDDGVRRDLVVELELESPDLVQRKAGPERLVATVLLERRGASAGDLEGDLQLAITRAMVVLDARTRLALDEPAQVKALLGSGDPDLALIALEWVRDHEASVHAPAVAEVLDHDERRVRLAAVETLAAVGGPSEARALIAQLRLSDAADAEASYRALAEMGGVDAERFLRFAAENEDEPSQRRAAAMALRSISTLGEEPSEPARSGRSHRR